MSTLSLSSAQGKWLMASTILASAMAFIDGSALNVVLPALQESLNASGSELFWILNAYLLMLASLILIGGALGDKFGRRKVLIWGIAIFISSSVACGLSADVTSLVAYRLVQGIGGALMIPGSLSLISSSIKENERGKAIGTWSAFTTIVTLGGPILGGALADSGLWRFIFFINVPLGIAALLMLWFRVSEIKDDSQTNRKLDYVGAFTVVLALASLTYGCLRLPAVGLRNVGVAVSLCAGLCSLALFIYTEYKSSNPMMPLKLFRNLTFSGANLLTLFLYAGLGAGMLFLSLNLVQVQGYSQLESGLTFLPFTMLMILLARFAGKLADKYGARKFLVVGPATAGLGLLLLSFVGHTSGPGAYWSSFFPGILVFGLGMSFTVAPLTSTVMAALDDHLSGIASGINNAITRVANVFANAIFGALAVIIFTAVLNQKVQNLSLGGAAKTAVLQQARNLGNAKTPTILSRPIAEKVKLAYQDAAINVYQVVMRISALLAFGAAVLAILFIRE